MKLEKKRYEDIVILRFVGEFDTFNLPLFSERVDRMIESGDHWFVLDVRLLTFINSTALGYLIRMSKRAKEEGGEVVLARPGKFIRKTLATLGLDEVFPVFETVTEALLYFRKGADIGRLDLESTEHDEALHGAVPILFRYEVEEGEDPPNQVGRIVSLYTDGLLFRYEPAVTNDPVEEHLTPGTTLRLKFRQPFALRTHYFEMDADVKDVSIIEEIEEEGGRILTIRVAYGKMGDEDRKHLDQFVQDQQIWRDEVRP